MVYQKWIYRAIMFFYTLMIVIIYYLAALNTIEGRTNSSWMWDWTRTKLAEEPMPGDSSSVTPGNSLVEKYLMHFKHNVHPQLKKLQPICEMATSDEHEHKLSSYKTTKQFRKASNFSRSKFYMTVPSFMRATMVSSAPITLDDSIDKNVYLPEDFPLGDDFYDFLDSSTITIPGQYIYPLYIRAVRTAMELLGFHRSRTRTSNHVNVTSMPAIHSTSTCHNCYSTLSPVDISQNVYFYVTQNVEALQSGSITNLDLYHTFELTTASNVDDSTKLTVNETVRLELKEATKTDSVETGKESLLRMDSLTSWTGERTTDGAHDLSSSDTLQGGNRSNENSPNGAHAPSLYDTLTQNRTNSKLAVPNSYPNDRHTDNTHQKTVEPMVLMMLEKNPSRMAVYKCFRDELPTHECMEHKFTPDLKQDICTTSTENTTIHMDNRSTCVEDVKEIEINLPGHLEIQIDKLGLNGSEGNLTLPCTLKLKYLPSLPKYYKNVPNAINELRVFNVNNVDYNSTVMPSIEPNVTTFPDLAANTVLNFSIAKTTVKYHLEQSHTFSWIKWLSKDGGANQTSHSTDAKLRNPAYSIKYPRKLFFRSKLNPMTFYTFPSTTVSETPSYHDLINSTVENELPSSNPLTTNYSSSVNDFTNYSQLTLTPIITYDNMNISENSVTTGEYLLSNNSNSAGTVIFHNPVATPVSLNNFLDVLAKKGNNNTSHRTGFMERIIKHHGMSHKLENNSLEKLTKQIIHMNEGEMTNVMNTKLPGELYAIKNRFKRDMRNPYDFQLSYLSYPMNPDFFKALESCKEAERKLRRTPLNLKRYQTNRFRREAPCKHKKKRFLTKMGSHRWVSKNESLEIKKRFL